MKRVDTGRRVAGLRRWRVGAGGLLALALMTALAACSGWPFRSSTAEIPPGTITVVMRGFSFHAPEVALRVGRRAVIVVVNEDQVTHGFGWGLMEDHDVDVDVEGDQYRQHWTSFRAIHLAPGERTRLSFTPTRSGAFIFRCDLHPHMTGELFVAKASE